MNYVDPRGLDSCRADAQCVQVSDEPIACYIGGNPVSDPLICGLAGYPSGPTVDSTGGSFIRTGEQLTAPGRITWTNVRSSKGSLVTATYREISDSLIRDSKCLDWLTAGWGGGGQTPEQVRRFISGMDEYTALGGTTSMITGQMHSFILDGHSMVMLINAAGGFFSNSEFGFSTKGGFVRSNTDRYRVMSLLHELAHYGTAQGFEADDASHQRDNNDLVYENCSKTINAFSNQR